MLGVALLLPGCAPKAQDDGMRDGQQEGSPLLTAADLWIAPSVDTTSAVDRDAIACLRRFFAGKLKEGTPNDYWYAPDLEQYGGVYSEVLYAEYDSVGEVRYRPRLMAIRERDGRHFLDVEWRADEDGADPHLGFGFLVRDTPDGLRLALPIEANTEQWERRTMGLLTYIVSPKHRFLEEQAREQQRVMEQLSTFFDVPVFPIRFYSFADPADLFAAKGFTHHPLMHTIASGGMVDGTGNVYSGNDKDIYVHEVVHLFSRQRFPSSSGLLGEGLAMLIGGSVEHDYAWHRANMERYLASDPAIDLHDRCNTYERDDIYTDTSVPYMIGGLICEHILRRDGREGLFKVMAAGTDPWPALAAYGITRDDLTDMLRVELQLPQMRVP